MISDLCIRRPILASVLSIVVTLAGAVALFSLPVEQYPPIAPPVVSRPLPSNWFRTHCLAPA